MIARTWIVLVTVALFAAHAAGTPIDFDDPTHAAMEAEIISSLVDDEVVAHVVADRPPASNALPIVAGAARLVTSCDHTRVFRPPRPSFG